MDLSPVPWDVREEHRDTFIHRMLERESLRRAGLPCGTSEDVQQLDAWIAQLRALGVLVDYRADIQRGFFLVYARDEDGEGPIRRPAAG
ncbi:hypothetical protein [Brachybacterium sp. J153]|uniref:hypothetical protein n=1 Tax=Brachybacterium sp. J153 TaxID=3116488 RepID=UPI002E77DB40|nr:hypothetical protein [Brachybacterium sp. J153]MEE1619653.1 hypothetical protein [Brachybacterium sp. J153]